jgi:hypothetical protein
MKQVLQCVFFSVFIVSCSDRSDPRLNDVQEKVNNLQTELTQLRKELADFKQQDNLSKKSIFHERAAFLMPTDPGFGFVKTEVGAFAISLQNVEQYASGCRITLNFGNTSTAHVTELHATIQYGNSASVGNTSLWKSQDLKLTQDFKPGTWTKVQVILAIAPSELWFVNVSWINIPRISLRSS